MAHVEIIDETSLQPGEYLIRCTVTTDGDYYDSPLGKVKGAIISNETTVGVAKTAISGQRVTITCTSADVVNLHIWGQP